MGSIPIAKEHSESHGSADRKFTIESAHSFKVDFAIVRE